MEGRARLERDAVVAGMWLAWRPIADIAERTGLEPAAVYALVKDLGLDLIPRLPDGWTRSTYLWCPVDPRDRRSARSAGSRGWRKLKRLPKDPYLVPYLYADGFEVAEIGERTGVGLVGTYTILAQAGVPRRASRGRRRLDHDRIVAAVKAGDTAQEIAQAHECSLAAVRGIARKAGVPIPNDPVRPPRGRQLEGTVRRMVADRLTDHEMAAALKVTVRSVMRLRAQFGLPHGKTRREVVFESSEAQRLEAERLMAAGSKVGAAAEAVGWSARQLHRVRVRRESQDRPELSWAEAQASARQARLRLSHSTSRGDG